MLAAFYKVQHVNLHAGGAVLAPWDIEPGHEVEEWVQAALLLSNVPNLIRRKRDIEAYLQKRRNAHPNYGRYKH